MSELVEKVFPRYPDVRKAAEVCAKNRPEPDPNFGVVHIVDPPSPIEEGENTLIPFESCGERASPCFVHNRYVLGIYQSLIEARQAIKRNPKKFPHNSKIVRLSDKKVLGVVTCKDYLPALPKESQEILCDEDPSELDSLFG